MKYIISVLSILLALNFNLSARTDVCSTDVAGTSKTEFPKTKFQFEKPYRFQVGIGSTELTKELTNFLNSSAELLRKNSNVIIIIEGHTDNKEDLDTQLKLSNERSDNAKYYLIAHGVKENQILNSGMGGLMPIKSNENEVGRKVNNRIEIRLMESTKK